MPGPSANPPNRFHQAYVTWHGEPPPADLSVREEETVDALARNESPDVGFRYSVNPYRGCFHACSYCYARPSHQYLDLGAGTDFDRKLVVKTNIAERLRAAFDRPRWKGELVAFSGNTDCYQPLEAVYGLTRGCLEVCLAYKNPVAVVTKGTVVRRDVDLLADLAEVTQCRVAISIAFLDDETARKVEPTACPPSKRFETLKLLSAAGVPTAVALAPLIPGLNESDIPGILERAAAAGARSAFMILLRLPREVLPVFRDRMEAAFPPERMRRIESAVRELRGGRMNESAFGARMRGGGARWEAVEALFRTHCRRLGLSTGEEQDVVPRTFRRPTAQLSLFDR